MKRNILSLILIYLALLMFFFFLKLSTSPEYRQMALWASLAPKKGTFADSAILIVSQFSRYHII